MTNQQIEKTLELIVLDWLNGNEKEILQKAYDELLGEYLEMPRPQQLELVQDYLAGS